DSVAEVDMNIVMTKGERFIEVQGTAEGRPFTDHEMDKMISLAKKGINSIFKVQEDILGNLLDI
ncbi:MAG: ribonuclease PH, partial [Candidatus Omnitrophica bacterium]|nr:ribonuclease PH [Candidatus Omnitrophota bacterium]